MRNSWNWRQGTNAKPAYGLATLVIAACVLVGLPLSSWLDPHNLTMVFLTGVVLIAIWLGTGPSLFASVLGLLAFNFFFVEPYYRFSVLNPGYYFTFAILLAASLGVGLMTGRLRREADMAARQKMQLGILYDIARSLASVRDVDEVLAVLNALVGSRLGIKICIWQMQDNRLMSTPPGLAASQDYTLIEWFFQNRQTDGRSVSARSSGEGFYCPMLADNEVLGVLSFYPDNQNGQLSLAEAGQFEAVAGLVAVSMQRIMQAATTVKAQAEAENERLRNVLLSSLSHDLRTPLTVMNGGLSTLLRMRKKLPREALDEVTLLWSQLTGLQKFVSNLLKMAAISSGQLKLKKEPYLIQEIMGAVLSRLDESKAERTVSTLVTGQLPMITLDGSLMEQVLINLLDNAIAHTQPNGNIVISAQRDGRNLVVGVSDDGPGFAEGVEDRIFERFEGNAARRQDTKGPESAGLGLAICKAIVEAHGGTITAVDNGSKAPPAPGATFSFSLPLTQDIE